MSGNEQLVANLRTRGRFGLGGAEVATEIEEAFLSCDRASFLREDAPPECYQDRPFRHGHFHHSAPSIYAAALVDFEFPSKQTGPRLSSSWSSVLGLGTFATLRLAYVAMML